MKVVVCDIIVVEREEELPEKCPGCGALLAEVGLVQHEYHHEWQRAKFDEHEEMDWGKFSHGEYGIPVAWHCGATGCDQIILDAHERTIAAEETPTEVIQFAADDPSCPLKPIK